MAQPATSFLPPRLVLATLCVIALGGAALLLRQEPVSHAINRIPAPVAPEQTDKAEPMPVRDIDALWQKYETLRQSLPQTANGAESNGSSLAAVPDTDGVPMTERQRERLQRRQEREQRERIRQTTRAEIQAAMAQMHADGDIGQVIHTLETLNQRLDAAGLEQAQRQQLSASIQMLRSGQKISDISNRILEAANADKEPDPAVLQALTDELRQSQQQLLRDYSELYKDKVDTP